MTDSEATSAMERLCRELADLVIAEVAYMWCGEHGIGTVGTSYSEDMAHARDDIERRIEAAREEDAKSYSELLKETAEKYVEHISKAAELDELHASGRVLPEGLEWPRFEDGEPVRVGDEWRDKRVYTVRIGECGTTLLDTTAAPLVQVPHGKMLKRPEPTDSWERLEEDVERLDRPRDPHCAYFGQEDSEDCSGCPACGPVRCGFAAAKDIVRRAKALSGVE